MRFFLALFLLIGSINVYSYDLQILSSVQIWVSPTDKNISDARETKEFKNFKNRHINLGFNSKSSIWLKLDLYNANDKKIKRVIKVDNPLLEKVSFYDQSDGFARHTMGMLYIQKNQKYLYPCYQFSLKPKEHKTIYISAKNSTTSLQFGISLSKKEAVEHNDKDEQLFIGLTVNELISNSIKHGFKHGDGMIDISLKQNDTSYLLKVGDNGDIFKTKSINSDALGLKLVHSLVENQLDGEILHEINHGLKYIIIFPKKGQK